MTLQDFELNISFIVFLDLRVPPSYGPIWKNIAGWWRKPKPMLKQNKCCRRFQKIGSKKRFILDIQLTFPGKNKYKLISKYALYYDDNCLDYVYVAK